jgi:hypothetical protein
MCDLAYVNLLREKVRQLRVEERRLEAFGQTPSGSFVPFILTTEAPTDSDDFRGIPRSAAATVTPSPAASECPTTRHAIEGFPKN